MRHLTFSPTHKYRDLFHYVAGFGHSGSKTFIGPWDYNLHKDFKKNKIIPGKISHDEWPYHNLVDKVGVGIEQDFYVFNSEGYRTHEFTNLKDGEFDIAIGCSYVEGIGVRKLERWDTPYQKHFGRKLINLGKGGSSVSAMSYILNGWFLAGRPKPKRVIAIWTEPSRETYVVDGSTPLNYIPSYHPPKNTDSLTVTYTQLYNIGVIHEAIWSNRFVQIYNQTNLLLQSMGIITHNYILGDLWPVFSMKTFEEYLHVMPKVISFNAPCSWHPYYPAADGSHPGPRGHQLAFETIRVDVENEKN